jgi:SlyX protein
MISQDISEELEERFQLLEGKVLYQDRTIDELNAVVTQQQDQIDRLTTELKSVRALFDGDEEFVDGGEEPPPPHY